MGIPRWDEEELEELGRTYNMIDMQSVASDEKSVIIIAVDNNLVSDDNYKSLLTTLTDELNTNSEAVIVIRGTTEHLYAMSESKLGELERQGIQVKKIVTLARNSFVSEDRGFKNSFTGEKRCLLSVDLQESEDLTDKYVQIIRLLNLGLLIGNSADPKEIAQVLNRISETQWTAADVEQALAQRFFEILPKIKPVDATELHEAHKRAREFAHSL